MKLHLAKADFALRINIYVDCKQCYRYLKAPTQSLSLAAKSDKRSMIFYNKCF